ncbi:MAG: 3-deoxy-7-phosphoheptulonate synthase [Planctomycetota bacterium]
MLLRLRNRPDPSHRESLEAVARANGQSIRWLDEGGRLVELIGPPRPQLRSQLEDLTVVAQVLDVGDSRERHERAGREDRCVRIGDALFGGGQVSVVAGPCAVESLDALCEIASAAAEAGAALLRGGAFKPRTSPHSFQGLGREALPMLAEARRRTGLGIVTEVLDPRDVDAVGEVADAFQIGARSMANAALLREVGRYGKPVVLKRGMAATVREFTLAAEYILDEGNQDVVLCERGVRGFDSVTRNLLDLGAVAHLKRATHLPVVVDPSHAAGRADLVRPLSRAGIAVGADGLLIESHPRPAEVHSDGAQAISLQELAAIVADARALTELDGRLLVAPRLAVA